ncbi:MAG: hypothetical protein KBB86_01550 [Candidatus Pacebacteria bacterium]|nr:hypothetical protein [Candidatus Paceibacterota bacterium]
MANTATKTANGMTRSYVQSVLEEKKLVYRVNFQFEQPDKFKQPEKFKEHLTKIILFVPTTDPQKAKTFEDIKLALDEAHIKYKSEERSNHVYIKYEHVSVPTSFIEKMQNSIESAKPVITKKIVVNKDDEFAPVLKIVKDYGFKACEKSRNSDSITFILPDQLMVNSFTEILDSFMYEHTAHAGLKLKEVTVLQNPNKTIEDIVLVEGFVPIDLKRFSQSLESSLNIVFWEIAKNNMPANQYAGDVSTNPNRSTRFSMPPTRANEQWVTNFAKMMNDVYSVDIDQPADKNTFFVVSKGDPGHAATTAEKVARQKAHYSSRHEVTEYLMQKGFNRKSPERPNVTGFQLHLKDSLPDWIETCYGEEADRKAMASEMYEALKVFIKHKHYKLDGFGRKTTTILFKENFRKGLDDVTILLIRGGFKQFNNEKTEFCGFVLARSGSNKKIIFSGGTEEKRILEASKASRFIEEKMPDFVIELSVTSFWIKPKSNIDKVSVEEVKSDVIFSKPNEVKLNVSQVARLAGVENWTKGNLKAGHVCFSRSSVNTKTGWQPVSLLIDDKIKDGKDKIFAAKSAFMDALNSNGYYATSKDTATKSFNLFVPTPERLVPEGFESKGSNPAREIVPGKTDKVESGELAKQVAVEDSSKSFGNQMIGFFIKQLTEDPGLYERIGTLYPQQKADPTETKKIISDIIEDEFANTSFSLDGPMGKFYSAKDINDLISRVIAKLPD